MTRGVEIVSADRTIQDTAATMAEHDIGAILVGTPERLEGIVTTRDIILRAVIGGQDPTRTAVGEIMSSTLFTCGPEDAVEAAAGVMQERQVRRLPVLDTTGRVVGIVTRRDLRRQSARQPAR